VRARSSYLVSSPLMVPLFEVVSTRISPPACRSCGGYFCKFPCIIGVERSDQRTNTWVSSGSLLTVIMNFSVQRSFVYFSVLISQASKTLNINITVATNYDVSTKSLSTITEQRPLNCFFRHVVQRSVDVE
jgi:hypothetical protein